MHTLIGNSSQGKNRAYGLLKKHDFVDHVQSINHHFSDNGIFGLTIQGAGSHSQDLMSVALEELSNLRNRVGDEELARAKTKLKMQVLTNMER